MKFNVATGADGQEFQPIQYFPKEVLIFLKELLCLATICNVLYTLIPQMKNYIGLHKSW